jgi:hypothetical protein
LRPGMRLLVVTRITLRDLSSDPEIVTTDHLAMGLQHGANLAVGDCRVPRQRKHG